MFGITKFLCLVAVISDYKVDGVLYNFGEDYNRPLVQCGNNSAWIPVEYSDVGVKGPYEHKTGLRASEKSCATTYPVLLVPETNLYITVYLDVDVDESGLLVVITDQNGLPLIKYMYNRTVKEYVAGWCKLSFPIEENYFGYITLFGYSGHNEIILVDSIQYNPEIKNVLNGNSEDEYIVENNDDDIFIDGDDNDITDEDNDDLTEENGNEENSEENEESGNDENGSGNNDDGKESDEDSDEGSGEGTTTTEPTTISTELPIITNPPAEIVESASLSSWVIALIVVASATGLALVAIAAYHLGKNKGLSENPLVFDDIQEPRSIVSIPRVRGVAESPIQIIDRPNFI